MTTLSYAEWVEAYTKDLYLEGFWSSDLDTHHSTYYNEGFTPQMAVKQAVENFYEGEKNAVSVP